MKYFGALTNILLSIYHMQFKTAYEKILRELIYLEEVIDYSLIH